VSSQNHALLVTIGRRVRALRKQKGWTQTDMAVCLDMNRGHISDIERGKREAGLITLQIIARGLDTTMDRILKDL
jgi:transcriptional regulator with XRE-family HTH domain